MKHLFFLVLVVALVSPVFVVPVSGQITPRPDWKERFRVHDKNGDGVIDRAEFQDWMVEAFFAKDSSHKGYLVYEDVKDVMTPEIFKRYDKNGDGKLGLQEFLNATFLDFQAADTNNDGVLTVEEIDVYIRRPAK